MLPVHQQIPLPVPDEIFPENTSGHFLVPVFSLQIEYIFSLRSMINDSDHMVLEQEVLMEFLLNQFFKISDCHNS